MFISVPWRGDFRLKAIFAATLKTHYINQYLRLLIITSSMLAIK